MRERESLSHIIIWILLQNRAHIQRKITLKPGLTEFSFRLQWLLNFNACAIFYLIKSCLFLVRFWWKKTIYMMADFTSISWNVDIYSLHVHNQLPQHVLFIAQTLPEESHFNGKKVFQYLCSSIESYMTRCDLLLKEILQFKWACVCCVCEREWQKHEGERDRAANQNGRYGDDRIYILYTHSK